MESILSWLKRLVSGSEPSGVIEFCYGVLEPASRNGKSPFGGIVEMALASIGARPGDIVEVDDTALRAWSVGVLA